MAATFVSGCATSQNHATAWEYRIIQGQIGSQLETRINQAGANGWQVIAMDGQFDSVGYAVVKRAKQ